MDSFLSSLQTLQKKPKTTTTNALDVFGTEPAAPKPTKTIAPDDYAPPKTSAPIFGAWPILPGAPTIPTCARAPPRRPREERPPRPPRADHYGGGGGRGRGAGGKGRGRGGKGGKGKGRGKGRGRGGKGGRGRGRGKGKGRKRDGPRAGAAVCAALDLDATDAPRVEELVKTFADAHKDKVQEHLAVARAQKQLDRRARHDPKFLEQLLIGALKREASMAAAVGRAEAIFRAPPTEDEERHTTLCAGVAQVLGSVARGWRAAAAEDERRRAAVEKRARPAPAAASDSEDDDDEDEAGAVVASHPLLGVAPPARKRRRAAAAPSNGVPRDVAVAAAAAGLDASASSSSSDSDSSSSSDDSDSDDDGAPNVPADLLAAAAAAGAY